MTWKRFSPKDPCSIWYVSFTPFQIWIAGVLRDRRTINVEWFRLKRKPCVVHVPLPIGPLQYLVFFVHTFLDSDCSHSINVGRSG